MIFNGQAWSIVDSLDPWGRELVVCPTPGDAAELGEAIAREAGHKDFHMWCCHERVVENWCPQGKP